MRKFQHYFLVLITFLGFSSCEKETTNMTLPERPDIVSSESLLRDSVFYYTHYFYLWQDKLPINYNLHQHRTADDLLRALRQYAKDPSGQVLDRFSFLDREKSVNSEIQNSQYGDFGFNVRYLNANDLYIKVVYENSPAYAAGLRRGWKVVEINGRTDLDMQSMGQDNFEFLFNALYGNLISMKVQDPQNQIHQVHLTQSQYQFNPILKSSILETPSKKVGYFALEAFVSQNLLKQPLNSLFQNFHAAGVESVIVDLRYNGGGDVSTANFISNLLAPQSVQDKLMNRYEINTTLTQDGWGFFLFFPEYFDKKNSLNIEDVYFLVSNSTASASELLINNLTPYMNVHMIGDDVTYGKPVGYFGWDIMGIDLYAVSFKTLNALGEGDYFSGLVPNFYTIDDVSKEFGDPQEAMLYAALNHVEQGSFTSGVANRNLSMYKNPLRASPDVQEANRRLESAKRKDMFDFRKSSLAQKELQK